MKKDNPRSHSSEDVTEKRALIIAAKRERISKRLEKIKKAVEDVRTIRLSRRSNIERSLSDNLLNAEKNRQEIMQHREQVLGFKVEKALSAGRVAIQSKESTAAKRRTDLESRLINNDLRRKAIMRIPRSKLLDNNIVEVELLRFAAAARKIQRFWRYAVLDRIIGRFKVSGLYGDKIQSAKFEQVAPLLQDKRIISHTSDLLSQLKKFSVGRSRRYKNPSRVFLSAFLICYFTEEIMPDFDDCSKEVKIVAESMLQYFDSILSGNRVAVGKFNEKWHEFYSMFNEWKEKDTARLIEHMYQHYMQLEQLRESVTSEPGANAEWFPQIDKQQELIKSKVLKIGGKSALARFASSQRQVGDASDSSEVNDLSSTRRRHDSVKNSNYMQTNTSPTSNQKDAVLSDVLQEYGNVMSNAKLAHELIMNPDFELTVDDNSMETRIRAIAKQAFFDKIREELEASKFGWVTGILCDIRGQIFDMLPANAKMRQEIDDGLDVDLINQQILHSTFNFQPYLEFIVERMLQLCAPIRDREIRAISSLENLVDQVKAIMKSLDDMKLDLANFRLRALRPHLMGQAVEYERSKFKEALEQNIIGLDKTSAWLGNAASKLINEAAARNPENVDHPSNRVRFDIIYFDALTSLLFSPDDHKPNDLAETLVLDRERIFGFQNEIQALTIVAALTMLTRNFVPEMRDNKFALASLKRHLLLLLEDAETTVSHLAAQIISTSNDAIANIGRTISQEQEKMVSAMVEKTMSRKDTVYSLLNRRIANLIRSHMTNGRIRNDSNSGLDIIHQEVDQLSNKIFAFSKHNREVYAHWYDDLLSKF